MPTICSRPARISAFRSPIRRAIRSQLKQAGAARLIPADRDLALRVRLSDRFYDLYVHDKMQKIVGDRLRFAPDQPAIALHRDSARLFDQRRGASKGVDRRVGITTAHFCQTTDLILVCVGDGDLVDLHMSQHAHQFAGRAERPAVDQQPIHPIRGGPDKRLAKKRARHADRQHGAMLFNVDHR